MSFSIKIQKSLRQALIYHGSPPYSKHLLLLLRNYNTPSPINFRNFYVPLKKEGLQGRNLEPMNCDLSGS